MKEDAEHENEDEQTRPKAAKGSSIKSASISANFKKMYDADDDEEVEGEASAEDIRLWESKAAKFIRSRSGIDEGPGIWVGRRPLGVGGFGVAGLWEKLDGEGYVVDVRDLPVDGQ